VTARCATVTDVSACPRCGGETCDGACMGLALVREQFHRWLGDEYDLDAIHAVLAAVAVERDAGDPLWVLLISGPGNAKTETVSSLVGCGAIVTSTITSPGALLSGTPKREKATDATGGLLRRLGARGTLVLKDVTSILSMNRDLRAEVLAALREVYDGHWERNVGADGGRSIGWKGRAAVVGAVTTAWDTAHTVIASMGDRFVLVRTDSTRGRESAGRRAIANTGHEDAMRADLSAAARTAIDAADFTRAEAVTDADREQILHAANLVTVCRTAVEFDYHGHVTHAHDPEAPTRFAKQLTQLLRGALALGLAHDDALRLVLRCARDSMPPLRLAILDDLATHPHSRTHDVRTRLDKPRNIVDRQLQALHMLGVLTCDEREDTARNRSSWFYTLADGIDPDTIRIPKKLPMCVLGIREERTDATH
jgi:hypothetical protein